MKLADGFNAADLRNVCTEAGMFAIRAERDYVIEEDFMKAVSPLPTFRILAVAAVPDAARCKHAIATVPAENLTTMACRCAKWRRTRSLRASSSTPRSNWMVAHRRSVFSYRFALSCQLIQ